MDEQRASLILHNPEQSKALDKAPSAARDSKVRDGMFDRLHHGDSARPRSAQSLGNGSKMRLMTLMKNRSAESHEAAAVPIAKDASEPPIVKEARRPSSSSGTRPVSVGRDAVKDNMSAVASTAPKPAPRTIFTYVDSKLPSTSDHRNEHDDHAPSAATAPMAPDTVETAVPLDKFVSGRLASVYGYSSLPFELAPEITLTKRLVERRSSGSQSQSRQAAVTALQHNHSAVRNEEGVMEKAVVPVAPSKKEFDLSAIVEEDSSEPFASLQMHQHSLRESAESLAVSPSSTHSPFDPAHIYSPLTPSHSLFTE